MRNLTNGKDCQKISYQSSDFIMGLKFSHYPIGYISHDDITKTTQPDNHFAIYSIDIHYTHLSNTLSFMKYIHNKLYTHNKFDSQQHICSNNSNI